MITNVLLALLIAGVAGVLFLLVRLERRRPEEAIEALQARLDQALRDEQRGRYRAAKQRSGEA